METPAKALQLILFNIEDKTAKVLLRDSLAFHPDYRVGDIIHLLHQDPQTMTPSASEDHQYVVGSVRRTITISESTTGSSTYALLVEVVELEAAERDDLGARFDCLTTQPF